MHTVDYTWLKHGIYAKYYQTSHSIITQQSVCCSHGCGKACQAAANSLFQEQYKHLIVHALFMYSKSSFSPEKLIIAFHVYLLIILVLI